MVPAPVRTGSSEQPPHNGSRTAEIDDAGVTLPQRRHYLSQILCGHCAGLTDCGLRRRFNPALVELTRQEALDDGYLLVFVLRKIGAVALPKKGDRLRDAA